MGPIKGPYTAYSFVTGQNLPETGNLTRAIFFRSVLFCKSGVIYQYPLSKARRNGVQGIYHNVLKLLSCLLYVNIYYTAITILLEINAESQYCAVLHAN